MWNPHLLKCLGLKNEIKEYMNSHSHLRAKQALPLLLLIVQFLIPTAHLGADTRPEVSEHISK